MSLNTTTLQTNLTTRLAALDGTETFEEILSLTAAIDNLTTNRFVSVLTYADLPNLTTTPLPSGSLIFVEEFNIMMMSVGTQWRGIDGRSYVEPPPALVAYAWGGNYFYYSGGMLGDNTTTNRSSPVTVVGGLQWTSVSAGYTHTLAIANTGIAYAWGQNSNKPLGDDTGTNRSSPVTVVGGITTWSQISAGGFHSLGVTSAGIAYSWGYNGHGRLGDGTAASKTSPVTVVGGITTWSQLSAGRSHSLGLTSAGIAYGWGQNAYGGPLGDDTITDRSSPVTVVGGITTWSKATTGSYFSLGLTSAGIAYAWGRGYDGRLGDDTATNKSSPVTVVGGITTWSQLSPNLGTSAHHSLGLTSAGIAYAWGSNPQGQLGDGTTIDKSSPVTVVGGITNWSELSTGRNHSIGRTSAGIIYAWGDNAGQESASGQLGDNSTVNKSSPVTVVGGITTWTQISAGGFHNIALKPA
jgi:alpha-tubulin suppressor-like RCC1 family protein